MASFEWTTDASVSEAGLGQKILALLMANPDQVFRIMRTDQTIKIIAIEGETWESG